jgi:hypothetical protein
MSMDPIEFPTALDLLIRPAARQQQPHHERATRLLSGLLNGVATRLTLERLLRERPSITAQS